MPFYPFAVLQNYGFGNKYHNAFRIIHAASTMPKYSNFRKDYARLASYVKPIPGSTSGNALAIRSLQRQLNKQKPEVQQWVSFTTNNIPQTTFAQWNLSPTDTLAAATDRDERVLGDSWINKSLEMRFSLGTNLAGFPGVVRVIVYVPKKAGTAITFTNMLDITDPNQMTVLYDQMIKPHIQGGNNQTTTGSFDCGVYHWVKKISLGNRKSTYIGTTAERNSVRIAVLTQGYFSGGSLTASMRYKLNYCNK